MELRRFEQHRSVELSSFVQNKSASNHCQDQTQTSEVPYELGDKMSMGLTPLSVPVCHTGSGF